MGRGKELGVTHAKFMAQIVVDRVAPNKEDAKQRHSCEESGKRGKPSPEAASKPGLSGGLLHSNNLSSVVDGFEKSFPSGDRERFLLCPL